MSEMIIAEIIKTEEYLNYRDSKKNHMAKYDCYKILILESEVLRVL